MAKSTKQKVNDSLAELNQPGVKAKKAKKFTLTIAGKKKTVKVAERDTDLIVSDKMCIIQAYEDELAGKNLKKSYKKPTKEDYKTEAETCILEYRK